MKFRIGTSPHMFCADYKDLDFAAASLRLIKYLPQHDFVRKGLLGGTHYYRTSSLQSPHRSVYFLRYAI